MGIFGRLKDILFDPEEPTEQIKITPEMRNDDTPAREVVVTEKKEEKIEKEVPEVKDTKPVSERELFKTGESSFPFFDFDEDEFENARPVKKEEPRVEVPPKKTYMAPPSQPKTSLDYEVHRKTERRLDYGTYEKTVITETTEKKKFKPSPIISPVYGILDKDYKKEDIIKKTDLLDMDVQKVRDKAFGEKTKEVITEVKKEEVKEEVKPRTTFYEETITVTAPSVQDTQKTTKSIDELLDDDNEDLRIPKLQEDINIPDVPDIPDSLEQDEDLDNLEVLPHDHEIDDKEDTLENDLFDLIDKMYDSKEDE